MSDNENRLPTVDGPRYGPWWPRGQHVDALTLKPVAARNYEPAALATGEEER
ncbi:MAG TPA: hypothetical protein VM865_06530 [Acidobacteriaceae bacterium]|nr:hypothetical protein [Acidobacteriaceae bacterium]